MPFARVGETQLHYERIETGSGRPWMIFLHEALGSIGQWKDFPQALCEATGYNGLVHERQGHGASGPFTTDRTPAYLHEYAWQELPALLDALDIRKPVTLFGHSDGGSIALLFAARFPERVNMLISEAAHVFVEKETLAGVRQGVAAYAQTNLPQKLQRYHGEKTDALFHAWCDTWLSPEFRDWNLLDELPKVQAPALILQGMQDEYGTVRQVTSIVAKTQGSAEGWMIPHCRHIPHLQQRDVVLRESVRFIQAREGNV